MEILIFFGNCLAVVAIVNRRSRDFLIALTLVKVLLLASTQWNSMI